VASKLDNIDGYRNIIDELMRGGTLMPLTTVSSGRFVVDQKVIYTTMEFLDQIYMKVLRGLEGRDPPVSHSDAAFLHRFINVLCHYLPWTDEGQTGQVDSRTLLATEDHGQKAEV